MQPVIPYTQSGHARQVTRTPELRLEVQPDPLPRLNVVLPHYFKDFAFDGIAEAMEAARVLSRGFPAVRFVSMAPFGLPHENFDLQSHAHEKARRVESYSLRQGPLPCHQRDFFFCSSWNTALLWLAHVQALESADLEPNPCYYLMRDFDPGRLGFGHEHCMALKSYTRPELTHAIFTSREVANWFGQLGYAFAREYTLPACLHPVLRQRLETANHQLRAKARDAVVFLVHGHPGEPRACFPVLAEGLYRFVRELPRSERHGLVFLSVGREHEHLILDPGVELKSLGRLPLERYLATLELAHVGVAFMASPRPAARALEMAVFGLHTITNSYAGKDLGRDHPLIHSLDFPEPDALAQALFEALANARRDSGRQHKALLPTGMSPHGLHASLQNLGVEPLRGVN